MQKYINKAENFTLPTDEQVASSGVVLDPSVHGLVGPIQIGFSGYWYPGVDKWVPSWKAMGLQALDGAGGELVVIPSCPFAARERWIADHFVFYSR
jgi:choline dehydrogenase